MLTGHAEFPVVVCSLCTGSEVEQRDTSQRAARNIRTVREILILSLDFCFSWVRDRVSEIDV